MPLEQPHKQWQDAHLWKRALFDFSLCFVVGFFTGFAPSSSSWRSHGDIGDSVSPHSVSDQVAASRVIVTGNQRLNMASRRRQRASGGGSTAVYVEEDDGEGVGPSDEDNEPVAPFPSCTVGRRLKSLTAAGPIDEDKDLVARGERITIDGWERL